MNRRTNSIRKLDATLAALEQLILNATDSEIRGPLRSAPLEAEEVRAMVSRAFDQQKEGSRASHRNGGEDGAKRQPKHAETLATRIARLRSLANVRPELAPRLNMVFGANRTPSEREVNDLTEELIRLGILKRPRS